MRLVMTGFLVWMVLSVLVGLWAGRALKASRDHRERMDKVWSDRPEQTAWLEYRGRKARQEAKAHREVQDQ